MLERGSISMLSSSLSLLSHNSILNFHIHHERQLKSNILLLATLCSWEKDLIYFKTMQVSICQQLCYLHLSRDKRFVCSYRTALSKRQKQRTRVSGRAQAVWYLYYDHHFHFALHWPWERHSSTHACVNNIYVLPHLDFVDRNIPGQTTNTGRGFVLWLEAQTFPKKCFVRISRLCGQILFVEIIFLQFSREQSVLRWWGNAASPIDVISPVIVMSLL